MGKIGEKTGGRKLGAPNKVTQSIRILLNTILPPEELAKGGLQCTEAATLILPFRYSLTRLAA